MDRQLKILKAMLELEKQSITDHDTNDMVVRKYIHNKTLNRVNDLIKQVDEGKYSEDAIRTLLGEK